MARLIRVPYLASLLVVSSAHEIDDLIAHPGLARAFRPRGRLLNRIMAAGLDRRFRHDGEVLPAFLPRDDTSRQAGQRRLFSHLDRFADVKAWPAAPVAQMARYVATGREGRTARSALAYAIAWPFISGGPTEARDDAYKPHGRQLWRLHRRMVRAGRTASLSGLALRLTGADRRARTAILDQVGGDPYGLHAVEVTLANAIVILDTMRRVLDATPPDIRAVPARLAWAAIRTAPETVVRQTGDAPITLPYVDGRVPAHTIVLLQMRQALEPDLASGYEFASARWSACPARRYVMGLFEAVAEAAVAVRNGEAQP